MRGKRYSDMHVSGPRPAAVLVFMAAGALLLSVPLFALGIARADNSPAGAPESSPPRAFPAADGKSVPEGAETAVLAGGCFWGVEAVFERLDGVYNVVSGYAGGSAEDAEYMKVGSGRTGHAESVRITYDPSQITYRTLLEVFFRVAHDPTQKNRQGPDVGSQYRSAVFYKDKSQRAAAESYIAELAASHAYRGQIVTEVTPLDAFYPAEAYHQDFLRRNPTNPYIVYWDLPKIADLEEEYPNLLKSE